MNENNMAKAEIHLLKPMHESHLTSGLSKYAILPPRTNGSSTDLKAHTNKKKAKVVADQK
jgi:hypothetical protein